jgi:hypothetical protein
MIVNFILCMRRRWCHWDEPIFYEKTDTIHLQLKEKQDQIERKHYINISNHEKLSLNPKEQHKRVVKVFLLDTTLRSIICDLFDHFTRIKKMYKWKRFVFWEYKRAKAQEKIIFLQDVELKVVYVLRTIYVTDMQKHCNRTHLNYLDTLL